MKISCCPGCRFIRSLAKPGILICSGPLSVFVWPLRSSCFAENVIFVLSILFSQSAISRPNVDAGAMTLVFAVVRPVCAVVAFSVAFMFLSS